MDSAPGQAPHGDSSQLRHEAEHVCAQGRPKEDGEVDPTQGIGLVRRSCLKAPRALSRPALRGDSSQPRHGAEGVCAQGRPEDDGEVDSAHNVSLAERPRLSVPEPLWALN